MATDPVCAMTIEPNNAAAKAEYLGTTYYFCRQGCQKAFMADPEKYIQGASPADAGGPARPLL